jgi:hypothetical protein
MLRRASVRLHGNHPPAVTGLSKGKNTPHGPYVGL